MDRVDEVDGVDEESSGSVVRREFLLQELGILRHLLLAGPPPLGRRGVQELQRGVGVALRSDHEREGLLDLGLLGSLSPLRWGTRSSDWHTGRAPMTPLKPPLSKASQAERKKTPLPTRAAVKGSR